jgi:hypothetical protein
VLHPELKLLLAKRHQQKTSQGLYYYCSAEGDGLSVRVTLFLGDQDYDLVGAASEEISKKRQVSIVVVDNTTPLGEDER